MHGLSRIISRVIQDRHCRRAAQKTSTKRKATQLLLTPAPAAAAALCTKVGPLGYSMVLLGVWGVRFMQRSCMFCLGDPKWALPFPMFTLKRYYAHHDQAQLCSTLAQPTAPHKAHSEGTRAAAPSGLSQVSRVGGVVGVLCV